MPIISGGSGSGAGIIANAVAVGDNAGDLSTNSAAFVDMGIATTIAATVGDKLYVVFRTSYSMSVGATSSNFKAVCTTSSNIIDALSELTATITDARTVVLAAIYTVVSGDLSGGSVAVKIQWATGAGTITAKNSGATVPRLSILNLLH